MCADLVRRHAGVLGLSACILSCPYDVPVWMPQILMDLSNHLNDPQPIEVHTVAPKSLGNTHTHIIAYYLELALGLLCFVVDGEENSVRLQTYSP